MQRSRAFTLIELLVVIAIIAILAAILFPVFAQAKEAAKKSVGVAHTKQMNLACIMYSADYDDNLPLGNIADSAPKVSGLWVFSVLPYTKNLDMFKNPQGAVNGGAAGDPNYQVFWQYIGHFGTIPTSQGKNIPYYTVGDWPITRALGVVGVRMQGVMGTGDDGSGVGRWGQNIFSAPSRSATSLGDVANTALIFDAGDPLADFATFAAGTELGTCVAGRETYNPGSRSIAGVTPRWNGGPKSCNGWREAGGGGSATIPASFAELMRKGQANIAFVDGHVKSLPPGQFYSTIPCSSDATVRCMKMFNLD